LRGFATHGPFQIKPPSPRKKEGPFPLDWRRSGFFPFPRSC